MTRIRPLRHLILAWVLWLCASAAQGAEARVRVEANEAVIAVAAEIEVRVEREQAWAVLTDYNRWAEFIPDLQVSRVISAPGEPIRLEQRGSVPWLPNFPLVMIALVEEYPQRAIRFQRIAGNIRVLVGEWQLHGKNPVRLSYRSTVVPGFPMPPEVSSEIFRHDARSRLEALAREMERRARLAGRG
ncbi:MAG: SRPBCC family protein [Burkholderiales bacterium]|nr:SRPBCC family protein [Burkholderiales bacterium]